MAEIEITTELMQMMCEKLKRMPERGHTLFPIKKIKGLDVRVILRKRTVDWYTLIIEPLDIFLNDNDRLFMCDWKHAHANEDEFIQDTAESILIALKTLKIDKLNGTFMTQKMIDEKKINKEDDDLWSRFCYDFELDKNFVLDFYDCEMCFKSTKTRINCGHSLCLECLIKVEIVEDQEDGISCSYRHCPLCHQKITYLL